MNLLEKYKTMVTAPSPISNTEERENTSKMLIKDITSNIRKSPVVDAGGSTKVAQANGEKVAPEPSQAIGWQNPHPQGTEEGGEETLRQIMADIWEPTYNRVAAMWPMGGFTVTEEVKQAGRDVDKVYQSVLSGAAKLADFSNAVDVWAQACSQDAEVMAWH